MKIISDDTATLVLIKGSFWKVWSATFHVRWLLSFTCCCLCWLMESTCEDWPISELPVWNQEGGSLSLDPHGVVHFLWFSLKTKFCQGCLSRRLFSTDRKLKSCHFIVTCRREKKLWRNCYSWRVRKFLYMFEDFKLFFSLRPTTFNFLSSFWP